MGLRTPIILCLGEAWDGHWKLLEVHARELAHGDPRQGKAVSGRETAIMGEI